MGGLLNEDIEASFYKAQRLGRCFYVPKRGAPSEGRHTGPFLSCGITNFAIMPYRKIRKTPGNVSRVIVRIR